MKINKIENNKIQNFKADYCNDKKQAALDKTMYSENTDKLHECGQNFKSTNRLTKAQIDSLKAMYINNSKAYKSEMDNLQFTVKPLKLFPEDVAKMESMPIEEKIEYLKYLRNMNRYTVE